MTYENTQWHHPVIYQIQMTQVLARDFCYPKITLRLDSIRSQYHFVKLAILQNKPLWRQKCSNTIQFYPYTLNLFQHLLILLFIQPLIHVYNKLCAEFKLKRFFNAVWCWNKNANISILVSGVMSGYELEHFKKDSNATCSYRPNMYLFSDDQ